MGSKVFLLLGLLVAIVLHISSQVAARDLAETSVSKPYENNGLDDDKRSDGYGGYPGRGEYGRNPGHGAYGGNCGCGGYPGHSGYLGNVGYVMYEF